MTHHVFQQPNGLYRAQPLNLLADPYICGHGKTPEAAQQDADEKLRKLEVSAFTDRDESEINLHLISAAPELLEALVGVLRYCVTVRGMPDVGKGRTPEQHAALNAALKVVRKATGQ